MKNMTDEELIAIARQAAIDSTHRYSYMPTTSEAATQWFPHRWVIDALRAVLAQEAGKCEPVAWIKPDVAKTLRKDECCYAFGEQNPKGTLIPLYTSPPAPVSVVLPERKPMPDQATFVGGNTYFCKMFDEARGYNQALDDVQACLNNGK